mmetsp:Transcript_9091/g.10494  ORF Transcript_9091/g.10494 Transcript_9091/m.10494 type:complete len:225 (+) Transcript_9091:203-877(+)|eukprot:CAMPEP_0197848318 /NCGR_PEP_ID=MMETSP1438-20131217/8265_1 /TAXON_ID=1461541 /ORGANISM="Pterosperma sp., Strain CCMP1384" /LENGTH=224 /DNA_ID=CAMNT_0043460491 /DNA_START=186 /DNA_END=860 /DNA_ORIENTATION=+
MPKDDDITQPWWERAEGGVPQTARDACRYSTNTSMSCQTVMGEDGVPQRKCEKIIRKLRMCPGKPPEEVEYRTEETVEPLSEAQKYGSFSSSSSFSSGSFGGSFSSDFPDRGGIPSIFGKVFGEENARSGQSGSNPFGDLGSFMSDVAEGMMAMDQIAKALEDSINQSVPLPPGQEHSRGAESNTHRFPHWMFPGREDKDFKERDSTEAKKKSYDKYKKDFEEV